MQEYMKTHKRTTAALICGVILLSGSMTYAAISSSNDNSKIEVVHKNADRKKSSPKGNKESSSNDIVHKAIAEVSKVTSKTGKVIESALDNAGLTSTDKAYASIDQGTIKKAASVIEKEPELPKDTVKEFFKNESEKKSDSSINDLPIVNDKQSDLTDGEKDNDSSDTGKGSGNTDGAGSNGAHDGSDVNNNNNENNGSGSNNGNDGSNENNGDGGTGGNDGGNVTPPANSAPTISASLLTVHVKDNVDLLAGAKATDAEDGDLTSQIKVVSNNVNLEKPGFYTVQLSVTDSNGATTTYNRMVIVLNARPVIHGDDIRVEAGTDFDVMEGITASDQEDGDLTAKIVPTESSVDTGKVGDTTISYDVVDSNGSVAKTFTRTITVFSEDADIQVDKGLMVFLNGKVDLLDGVKASNKYNDDFTGKIITDVKALDTSELGEQKVTYSVVDRFGHKTEKTVTYQVIKDVTPMLPTIE